uniref:SH3 domain-containing protein n=1 Tax=Strigamia maritima TaxID=126957 RepID=T1JG37_STRMM
MSKKCARCDKTVYPLEELKCLDKVWHKTCFKCQECGMTLNMRTYKGFNRLPYCNAHCPQAKHTTVADTPEIRRIQENTKIQSTVKYHEDFEKQKGKVTQIADDPETLRIKQNTRIISNVAYHGDLEKKAIMEQRRPAVAGEKNGDDDMEFHIEVAANVQPSHSGKYSELASQNITKDSPYSARQSSTLIYSSEHGPVSNPSTRRVGSIADYDPLNDKYGSLAPAPTYRAMYDYAASDMDEVSFLDGDFIVNCTPIDEGWMTGTVQRTGQTGMLPANYVETIN